MSERNTTWKCPECGTINEGRFCTNCGAARPEEHTAEPQHESVHEEPKTVNAEYVHKEVPPTFTAPAKKSPKKSHHPAVTILAAAVVGLAAGFGGGYLAVQSAGTSSGGTTVITKEVASDTSSTSADSTSGTITAVAAKAAPSVVEIQTETTTTTYGLFGGTYTSEAAGSGVIISDDGYIITNNHVIEDANTITVRTYDDNTYTATLVGTDSKSDIAVIKIDATGLTAATIGDSSTIQVGDTAVVIGNPLGTLGGTVTNGIISATDREITINNESMNLIQTNAAINNGNSGGGLFDGNGNLIGIVNAKDSGVLSSGATIEGLGFAIPINEAMDVATQLIENGYVTDRATLGVTLQTLTQDYGNYPAGLYIASVTPGGGAEAAGLQAYDRIIKADDQDVSSYTELSAILSKKNVGDTLKLTVVRDGQEMEFNVTLTAPIRNTETSNG
ncbi:MAG: trypsin-like peptidase domain-containing protein [Bulleidia sp.]